MNPRNAKLAGLVIASLCCSLSLAKAEPPTAAEKLGWRLGVQAWTFRALTFFETVDQAHQLGLKYIEMYPGQKLKPGADAKTGPGMSDAEIAEMQAQLKAAGVKLVSFGVNPIPTAEAAARKHFEWAKKLGLEVLVTETTPNELLDKLSGESGIKIALHNHPTTWPPDQVLAATTNLSPRIGACADTGHWKRAGLNPVATFKQMEGRVVHSHFKDVAPVAGAKGLLDQPWGTGQCDVPGMLAELKRQHYHGYLMIEYEHGMVEELMRDLPKCITFFNQTATELSK